MSADPWYGPPCPHCKGKGEIVYTRGNHWTSVRCDDCHGTGLADAPAPASRYRDDGTRVPEDGEAYDEAVHGRPGPAYALSDAIGCRVCFGAGVVLDSVTLVERPCAECGARRD